MNLPLYAAALLPAQASDADAALRQSLRLADAPAPWVVVLVLLPLAAGVVWLGYRSEALSRGRRALLMGLRLAALAALALILFRPVSVERREEVHPAEVLVLVDDSASMRRHDAYAGDETTRRALARLANPSAAGGEGGAGLGSTTRAELVQRALESEFPQLLEERDYLVRRFRFAGELSPMGADSELTGRGATTQIGSALSRALGDHRGRHVTDIVLFSDGRQNAGPSASDAARAAATAGVAVHTVVVGDTRPERNALLELVEAPTSALEGDELAFVVRVAGRGIEPGERVDVFLEEFDLRDDSGSTRVLAEQRVQLSEGGERISLIAPPGAALERTRERRFRIQVSQLDGETLLDDNELEVSVRVEPAKIRVLFVDGYPRWEYRFLKELLKRSDANIEVQVFLQSATPDFRQEATRGMAALESVPTSRKELLENYDVIILGDVNPYSISPDPERCEEFLASVVEFVERGGGLLLVSGEYDNPRAYVSTALEVLFPVVLDSAEMASLRLDTTQSFRPQLESPALPHEIVRLLPDADANRALWEDPGGLEGQFWFQPIKRAKPGAQVLLRHPTAGNENGRYPLLVAGYYPSGRTLFTALDSTWMWRFHFGDRYHERFWRGAIRWLALGRLKSGDRRVRLEVPASSYDIGATVGLEARVLDEDFRPSTAASQKAWWQGPEGEPRELELLASPERRGVFRARLMPDEPGLYRAWIEAAGERIASAEFEVVLPSLENRDPAPDAALLREISLLSEGRAVELAQLADLAAEFPGGEERREPISSQLSDIWDSVWTLLAVLALLATEWVLRKRWEMV